MLNNQKDITKPVVVSTRFMNTLFKLIESDYADKAQKYRFRSYFGERVGRLKNHITKADLQLATTIQVGFNTLGQLEFSNKHQIYLKLKELYENIAACSKEQFYAAFEKFVEHGLILSTRDEFTGDEHFTLNHYLEPESGKIGRFVLLHPVVFTQAFASMPICKQKLFYHAAIQQGQVDRELQWNLRDGLFDFIHRNQVNQVRDILSSMTSQPVFRGQALFAVAEIKRNVIGGFKAVYKLNPSFVVKHETGAEEYHEVIPAKKGYRRLTRYLRSLFAELGIGEFELLHGGRCFHQLVFMLKDKNKSFIRYVVYRIQEIYNEHFIFPENILDFLKEEIQNKAMTTLLAIIKESRLYSFLVPYGKRRQERITEFMSKFAGMEKTTFRKMCAAAAPQLYQLYGIAPANGAASYTKVHTLDDKIDIQPVRMMAYHLRKSPYHYHPLEHEADQKLWKREHPSSVIKWLQNEIGKLPQWELEAAPPPDFKLEDFMNDNFKPGMIRSL
jgi:hypothetical protein